MQKVHEPIEPEPLERIHLYVVREEENRQPPSLSLLLLSFFLLCLLITVGVVVPYRPPLVRQTVKVPALFFSLKTFSVQVAVLPTGMKTYPATNASGTLTITNGSILSQHLPAGMIFTATNGIEVVTTASVDVAAGNGASYGVAYVSAKAINAGVAGNLSPLAIDAVYGTSLYIKNDQSFTGGKNSSSVPNIQPQDTQTALTKARATLIPHMLDGMLYQPCAEKVTGTANIHVTWTCQFVTYQIAGKVLKATVHGRFIMVDVLVIARKQILETK